MSVDNSSSAIKDGSRLPHLPTEIRLQIWEEVIALEEPRLVEIWFRSRDEGVGGGVVDRDPPVRSTPLLYTCRETRETALKTYQLYLGRFPFHPAIDTLYLSQATWSPTTNALLSRLRPEPQSHAIHSLAADLDSWSGSSETLRTMIADLRHFAGVQRLILVVAEDTNENRARWSRFMRLFRSLQASQKFRLRKWRQYYSPSSLLRVHNYPKTCELALKTPRGLRFYDTDRQCFGGRGVSNGG